MIEEHALLAEQLDSLRGVQRAKVRIVCGKGFVADFVHHGLERFSAISPGIQHGLTLGSTEGIVDTITNGDADIGLVYNPLVDPASDRWRSGGSRSASSPRADTPFCAGRG